MRGCILVVDQNDHSCCSMCGGLLPFGVAYAAVVHLIVSHLLLHLFDPPMHTGDQFGFSQDDDIWFSVVEHGLDGWPGGLYSSAVECCHNYLMSHLWLIGRWCWGFEGCGCLFFGVSDCLSHYCLHPGPFLWWGCWGLGLGLRFRLCG